MAEQEKWAVSTPPTQHHQVRAPRDQSRAAPPWESGEPTTVPDCTEDRSA